MSGAPPSLLSRLGAESSSAYSIDFPASLAIDSSYNSLCASGYAIDNWLSVRIPAGTHVGEVHVYNRRDAYASSLSDFEVWVASAAGNTSSSVAIRCGAASYNAATEPAPCEYT